MEGEIQFLGTGASLGIPVVGCFCSTCLSQDTKDKRSRAGYLIKVDGKKILVDAGPDFRSQALTHQITALDGFILTHAHYDHMGGFDDLRVFAHKGQKLPCFLLQDTFVDLIKGNRHLFTKEEMSSPFFLVHTVEKGIGHYSFCGIDLSYFTYFQMGMPVMGLRIGSVAFVSDIKEYDVSLIEYLRGTTTLIISALRYTSSPMHFSIDDALQFAQNVGAEKTYLTHIAHEITHDTLQKELPKDVSIAYDGLSFPFLL